MSDTATEDNLFRLPAILDLRNVRDVRDALLQLTPASDQLSIDGSGVSRLSTAGAQILAAFQHHLQKQGCRLDILNPSAPLRVSLEMLGLKTLLKTKMADDLP